MSVIYRSLQQLKTQEVESSSRKTPQAVAPRTSQLILRAGLMILVFCLLVGAGLYFVQQEVQTVPLPPQQEARTGTGKPAKVVVNDGEDETVEEVEEAVSRRASLAPIEDQAPIVRQRLVREVEQKEQKPLDLTKPTKALEGYFQQRARKNENVLALERNLIQASNKGDLGKSKQLLTSMTREMGKKESATKYKWEGYLALKEKRYADAENFFRRAVGLRSADYVSNINLVYALLGQGKREEAVLIYRKLVDKYPMNEKVLKLGKALGEL